MAPRNYPEPSFPVLGGRVANICYARVRLPPKKLLEIRLSARAGSDRRVAGRHSPVVPVGLHVAVAGDVTPPGTAWQMRS